MASPLLRACRQTQSYSTEPTSTKTSTTVAEPAAAAPVQPKAPFSYPDPKRAEAEARKQAVAAIPGNFNEFSRQKNLTSSIGARVESGFVKTVLSGNPPSDASLEDLMAAQAHMGHNTANWM